MANLTSTLTVRLLNQVSGPAAAAARSILGIGNAVTAANARGGIGGMFANMARHAEQAEKGMRALANSMRGISFPLLLGGGFAARQVYEFEKVANTIEAVTNITKQQRDQLQSYAQSLNSLFPFSNTQIMQSALELGRAGLNFDQIMGALRSTLNLALAGNIELKESSDIATNVLTAMRLPMRTTEQVAASLARVNDVLSFAANQSNVDVRQLGETFKYVGPMAAAAGMDIESVAGMAMVMANNGIRASEAGVALRSALVRMVKPTRDMSATLGRLGINLSDFVTGKTITAKDIVQGLAGSGISAAGMEAQIDRLLKDPRLKGSLQALLPRLVDVIGGADSAMDRTVLAEHLTDILTSAGSKVDLAGFMKALRDKGVGVAEMSRLFDVRQGGRLITLEVGADSLDEFIRKLRTAAVGSTDRAAGIMQQGVVGSWTRFQAAVENMVQAMARSGVLDTVTGMLNRLSTGLEAVAKFNPAIIEWGTYAAMIAAAAPGVAIVAASIAKIVALGAGMAGGGAAVASGAGAAAVAGGAAGAAARGGLRAVLGRLGVLGGAYMAGDLAWRAIGGHSMVERYFNGPMSAETIMQRIRDMERMQSGDELLGGVRRLNGEMPAGSDPMRDTLGGMTIMPNAGAAGQQAGGAFGDGFVGSAESMMQRAEAMLRAWAAGLNLEVRINPRINLGDLRGIHADIGVTPGAR